ncbi:PLP-dependent transferase [Atractiella rhizophila]|nr:PLP-dependent transferase [Atractiella rhizophila]
MGGGIDYSRYLSVKSKKWPVNPIRGYFDVEKRPGMISFLSGKPHPTAFPIKKLTTSITCPFSGENVDLSIDGEDLQASLQYGPTTGAPKLVEWLTRFQELEHKRSFEGEGKRWRISMGNGSQDLMTKVFDTLVDPGQPVLFETPVYLGALACATQTDYVPIEVATDGDGVVPASLRSILSNWSNDHPDLAFPRLFYTCPTGSNPTGRSTTEARKKEILDLIYEYELLLLEDEPYWFIYYGEDEKPRSYFELEGRHDGGRVLRLDSFSKVLSSGLRLGFLTGPREILDRVDLNTSNTNLQVSSTTQYIALKVMEYWGVSGLKKHAQMVAQFYKSQRDLFESLLDKHLRSKGLADWDSPKAGFFIFLRLHLSSNPEEEVDTTEAIREVAIDKGVLAIPGFAFMPRHGPSSYIRCSFSMLEEGWGEEGVKRLAETVREVRRKRGEHLIPMPKEVEWDSP